MTQQPETNPDEQARQEAKQAADTAFDKLSMLGPVAWLYGRTQDRRFLFMADLDWAVMPPLILNQCRIFMQGKIPFAFMTWAFVNDEVHRRLNNGDGKLAPHEWKSGPHAWLIDGVTPFGGESEMLNEVVKLKFADYPFVNYLVRDQATQKVEVKTLMTTRQEGGAAN